MRACSPLSLFVIAAVVGTASAGVYNGTAAGDALNGNGASDQIYGLEGDDTLNGNGGNDFLSGGLGKDTLKGGPGLDKGYGGPAKDVISGGSGNDYLVGGAGNDNIKGNAGWDKLLGGLGNDNLSGGPAGLSTDVIPYEQILPGQGGDVIICGLGKNVITFTGLDLSKDVAKNRVDTIQGFNKLTDLIKYESLNGFYLATDFSGGTVAGTTSSLYVSVLVAGVLTPVKILQVNGNKVADLITAGIITFTP